MKWMHKSKRIFAILLILGLVCLPMLTIKCYAGIKDATVFQDVTWHYQGETGIFSDSGCSPCAVRQITLFVWKILPIKNRHRIR